MGKLFGLILILEAQHMIEIAQKGAPPPAMRGGTRPWAARTHA